jgi:gliding motility-associated-like protein
MAAGLLLLNYVLSYGLTYNWLSSPKIVLAILASMLALFLVLAHSLITRQPAVDLSLLSLTNVRFGFRQGNCYPSTISAKRGFSTYNWSDGETTGAITANQAANLLLTVTDGHGCSGTETIAITTKQCLLGIRFPNAFTPDGNGANDIYRPYVLGNMLHYHIQIFSRWGQLVFASDDYSKGWDGRLNGNLQAAGTFVWICEYQFSGESMKTEKGTLLLIQ